jgi:hypothetical protein
MRPAAPTTAIRVIIRFPIRKKCAEYGNRTPVIFRFIRQNRRRRIATENTRGNLMPYFVYNIQEKPKKLEHLETFAKYREAKEFVRAKRAESGDIESIRMIFARNDVEAEKLLKAPREERVIGED